MKSKPTKESQLRVGIHTFGCRSNYADTVDVQGALLDKGVHPCGIEDDADVYLINTCTVTDSADKDVYKLLRKIKKQRPNSRIVVTGCMAEAKQAELAENSIVDEVVGPGQRELLVSKIINDSFHDSSFSRTSIVSEVHPNGKRVKKSLPLWKSISLDTEMPSAMVGPGQKFGDISARARFHLRVQEGCENSCTFCIIPSTRGRLSSRPLDLILADIEALTALGYQEVVLSGTHLGGWGEDIGMRLSDLLEALGKRANIARIRLSSIDPNDLTDSCINCLVKYPIFCNHLHVCFQAFCDSTLKRMNRKYRLSEAVELIEKLNQALPRYVIGSDVIAGFPGESRGQLEEGMELFLRLPISYLHVFPYSERADTAALRLDGEIPLAERRRRAARWRAIAQRKKEEFLSSLVGQQLEVVCEQVGADSVIGTSSEFATCKVYLKANNTGLSHRKETKTPRAGELLDCLAQGYDSETGEVLCELLSQVN